jgi:predicted hydrocarbon binding protein
MEVTTGEHREVALPVSIFGALRQQLASETSPLAAIHALHAAGHAAGVEAAGAFRASLSEEMEDVPAETFWQRMQSYLGRRGWGTLKHLDRHEAVGFLTSHDWAEASPAHEAVEESACSFTNGFLSGFLTQLAGGPVAVLEVTCRGRDDEACTFAFGSEGAIHDLYGQLLESEDLDGALGNL